MIWYWVTSLYQITLVIVTMIFDWILCDDTIQHRDSTQALSYVELCCDLVPVDFIISSRVTSLALRQWHDYPSASEVTRSNMGNCIVYMHHSKWYNHNTTKHNKNRCHCHARLTECTSSTNNKVHMITFLLQSQLLGTMHWMSSQAYIVNESTLNEFPCIHSNANIYITAYCKLTMA